MTDRPLPDAPSTMNEGPVHDAPSTMAKDPFHGTSSTMTDCALKDSSATVMMTDPVLLEIASVTAKEAVDECSTQSVIILEIEAERSTTPDSKTLEEGSAHSLGENHQAPAASITPFQIRPIPTMAAPKTGRKHKRQKSEVLTSTPVKAE